MSYLFLYRLRYQIALDEKQSLAATSAKGATLHKKKLKTAKQLHDRISITVTSQK